ncbi:MAG: F(420)H(2) dehydrogenase subunit I [Methanomassiliicoccales archaeon PtaU1.Bin124]|nr:MAG: F(420)H(2) dehydrogenase subunit I [Methanomassiliicoccales archaeon PtaU1.Bin124]
MAEDAKNKSTYQSRSELKPRAWIADGLRVTFKTLVRTTVHRPNTIQYPFEKLVKPDCYRGRPGIVLEKCIACSKCVRICPNRCIEMVPIESATLGKVKRPQVNVARCMMCGYCAEVCPTNAMIVTPEFELAAYSRSELMFDPFKLQFESKPGYEVCSPMILPSEIKAGKTEMHNKGDMAIKDTVALDAKKCISCSRCEKTCPVGAVKMTETGEINPKTNKPIKKPAFDNEKCVSCEQCVDVCPKSCLSMKEAM